MEKADYLVGFQLGEIKLLLGLLSASFEYLDWYFDKFDRDVLLGIKKRLEGKL